MDKTYNIGIDLGTTSCTVSAFINNRIKTIPIDSGAKYMPSYVYFGDIAPAVGRVAQLKETTEPKRVIYGAKRLLGSKYTDSHMTDLMSSLSYDTKESRDNNFQISIQGNDKELNYSPVEITSFLISQAVKNAAAYLKGTIADAVISVPAYYNNVQRNDTINAGKIAGLENVHLVSDPTAAAIAYGLINTREQDMVLVFDFGGGSLDISIIEITGKCYTVMGCSGNTHIGGDDITFNLLQHVLEVFKTETGITIERHNPAYIELRNVVEKAKIALSVVTNYSIDFDDLLGHEFHYELTRQMLENINHTILTQALNYIDECLINSYVDKDGINHVLVVGGSSAIPYIQNHLIEKFGKTRIWSNINSSDIISQGAAIIAGISHDVVEKGFDFQVDMYTTTCNPGNAKQFTELQVNEITPMNLGIRVTSGQLSPIITAGSSIPCTQRKQYEANSDYQKTMRFKIYQGCDEYVDNCTLISEVVVPIETPGLKYDTVVEVAFSLDSNSTLYVEATELKTMKVIKQVVDMGTQVLTEKEVEAMKISLHTSMVLVEKEEKAAIARNDMNRQIIQLQRRVDALRGDDIEDIKSVLIQYKEWLKNSEGLSEEEIKSKCDEMKKTINL